MIWKSEGYAEQSFWNSDKTIDPWVKIMVMHNEILLPMAYYVYSTALKMNDALGFGLINEA